MARGKAKAAATGPVEGPWALPEGWRWEKLEDVVEVHDYLRRPINQTERQTRLAKANRSALYPYYGATGLVGEIDGFVADGEYVLLGEDGAPFLDLFKDKAYLVSGKFWVNNHAHVLKAGKHLENRWLLHWLNTFNYRDTVNGTTRLKLTQAAMNDIPVPVPRHDAGRVIVARIDALFAEIDDGEAALARARADLATWRKALLKAAVTGALTADWRAANPPAETGAALLARILADRRTRWLADPRNKAKRYVEPAGPDLDPLPELPAGWSWATAEMLTNGARGAIVIGPFGSDLKTTDYAQTGIPLIFVRHIRANDFTGLRPTFVSPEKGQLLANHIAVPGDVLITKMGDPPGDASVYPLDLPAAVITADCIRWRPSAHLSSKFLSEWVNSQPGRAWIISKTKGVAQQKITLELFRSMPIPVPPADEAAAIERELKQARLSVEHLAETEDDCSMAATTLRQSILAAAFRGDLAR